MIRRSIFIAAVIIALPVLSFGQLKQDTKLDMAQALSQPTKLHNIVGLIGLDPNRFSMSHSYSMTFGSFDGNSYHNALYLNTMRYQLTDPLSMYLQVGFQHHPFANSAPEFDQQNQVFISGAGVQYAPSDNLKLQFEFSQQPNSYYYSPYRSNQFRTVPSLFEQEEERGKQ